MNDIKILIAEDDRLNRMMLARLLEKLNVQCRLAEDGSQALEMFECETFDGVFLDVNMPGLSGPECAVLIREKCIKYNCERPYLACISADEGFKKDKNFDIFLPKPFRVEVIREILHSIKRRKEPIANYNIDEVVEKIGLDKETILMLLGEFIKVMDEETANLKKAVDENDAEMITHVAHKMKGASANMMVENIRTYCAELQNADKSDRNLVLTLLANIEKNVSEFREKFKDQVPD